MRYRPGMQRFARDVRRQGFTIVELMTALVISGILAGMAVTRSKTTIEQARIAKAIGDIRALQAEIQGYEVAGSALPLNLAEIGRDQLLDPWGRPYVYINFAAVSHGPGVPPGARRDVFLVPINSTFDLYSRGPDGQSQPPLPAGPSQDDIVRGNDGGFIGVARKF